MVQLLARRLANERQRVSHAIGPPSREALRRGLAV